MKKIIWKAYLYGPAVVLLSFIIYLGGPKFKTLDDRGIILLAAFSGALSGFFHVFAITWEKEEENGWIYNPIIKYFLIYRPPIAMAFTLLCSAWLFEWFQLIRVKVPALAPVSVVTIGLLIGSFSYWVIQFAVKVLGRIIRFKPMPVPLPSSINPTDRKPSTQETMTGFAQTLLKTGSLEGQPEIVETDRKKKRSNHLAHGGEFMDSDTLVKKTEQGNVLSLQRRIMAAGGLWDWLKLLLLGYYLLIIPVILVFFVIDFWPVKDSANAWLSTTLILNLNISFHLRMLLLILMSGALGSYIHVATSFSYHIAKRDFEPHWYWWYWMRLPIGAVLALVLIMVINGEIFVNPFINDGAAPSTAIGIAALIGLFSRHLLEKFRDIFDVILHPREKRGEPIHEDTPGKLDL